MDDWPPPQRGTTASDVVGVATSVAAGRTIRRPWSADRCTTLRRLLLAERS
jgi:hypothetical protein